MTGHALLSPSLLSGPPALSRAAVDRSAHRRRDAEWLRAAWSSPSTGVVVLWQDTAPVSGTVPERWLEAGREPGAGAGAGAPDGADAGGAAATGPNPTALGAAADPLRLVVVAPDDAPLGERYLLGEEDGRAWFAVDAATAPPLHGDARLAGLREAGALLDDRDAGLLTHAVALAAWHERSRHCPRCGGLTHVELAGASRRCEDCGTEHHPRTDPAVIMLVHDGRDRCVLGRQPGWPPGLASVLAGFVEPGESAEMAVAREVLEEVGLVVDPLTVGYLGSQPWPFPASLMLAYTAQVDDRPVVADPQELESARWWSRAEIEAGLAAGDLLLPPPVSIAHRLIRGWLEQG